MKKILALLLAAVMLLGLLAGCSSSKDNTADNSTTDTADTTGTTDNTGDTTAASDLNVGVFYYNFADAYITTVRNAMDGLLNAAGITYNNYDGAGNQATQLDQINTAITNGANLLVVNIVETSSPDAAQQACDAAKNANIPIVFFNREVENDVVNSYENCAFVGTDAPEAGHMQGEMIGDYLVENFDAVDLNGDGVISYVMFKGQEGNKEAEFRTQYAVEDADAILEAAGKSALSFYDPNNTSKYLVDTAGNWSAQAATDYMNTILAAYSEASNNMIELVIANNDNMAEGAIAALQAAGYNTGEEGSTTIPVYGVDAMDSAVQKIENGQMTGTVKQDGEAMANTIMTLITNIKDGASLMDNTDSYNVDDGVAKIRVPYAKVTA